jgi:hypothetical protein
VAVTERVWDDDPRSGIRWLAFAAAVLIVSGIFKVLDALWAFKYDDDISEEVQTVLFENDPAAWGWLWLAVGAVLILSGFAVVKGSELARWVGIVAAGLAAIINYPWIWVQPIWTLLNIGLAISVIFALATYGGRRMSEIFGRG